MAISGGLNAMGKRELARHWACLDGAGGRGHYVAAARGVYQWRRIYVRENKSNVCPTLTANMGTGGHNVPLVLTDHGIRKLTPMECFKIQGFPKSFIIPNGISNTRAYKQAGNSVVVPVIERIAEQIQKVF